MSTLLFVAVSGPASAQKTDIIVLKKGSRLIGEIKELQDGKLKLSTWAMSIVYIEWPKVLSVTTDKQFEITMVAGNHYYGSIKAAADSGMVVINYGSHAVEVETASIVDLKRIKPNFWEALEGSIDLGADYTQQYSRTDLSFGTTVNYKKALNNYRLTINGAYSRQDSINDISRLNSSFRYARELKTSLFGASFLSGERNSQLELDFRTSLAVGFGRFLFRTNKRNLVMWGGLAYAREKYTGKDGENTLPAFVSTEFQYFLWGRRNREFSTSLMILPLLSGETRWRLKFVASMRWEIASSLYFNFKINEDFDSNPPSEFANKNAFSTMTSLGWTF